MMRILFNCFLVLAVFTMLGCANQSGTKNRNMDKLVEEKMTKSTNPDNNW
jgi:hypothetical protein